MITNRDRKSFGSYTLTVLDDADSGYSVCWVTLSYTAWTETSLALALKVLVLAGLSACSSARSHSTKSRSCPRVLQVKNRGLCDRSEQIASRVSTIRRFRKIVLPLYVSHKIRILHSSI
jgi:hypothetical protein